MTMGVNMIMRRKGFLKFLQMYQQDSGLKNNGLYLSGIYVGFYKHQPDEMPILFNQN